MAHDVFISYSSKDKDSADTVCTILEQKGVPCWMAPRDITPGTDFSEAIIDGIKNSKVFVLIYSSNSNDSKQVIREVDRAVHNGLSIINFRLEDVPLSKQLEYYLSSVHWLDAITPSIEQHINQLYNVVQIFLKPKEIQDAEIAEALKKGIIKQNVASRTGKASLIKKKRIILVSGIFLAVIIALTSLVILNVGGIRKAKAGSIESIVILPFGNYTGTDTLDAYLSGMHSLLINELGKIQGLRIISKVSSDSYRNSEKSIPEIAKELNVDAAIELGVLSFGDSIFLQPRLMSGGTNEKQIWIGDYRASKGNLFNLYNQIIRKIADEVKISLTPAEEARLAESRTIDREVMDAYLKDYGFWGDFSPERFDEIRDYLNSAIEKDPDWAPLYLTLANYWIWLAQWGYEQPSVVLPKASINLNKALELDPDLNDAHQLLGWIAFVSEWNWEKAEKEFLTALAINPNNAHARIYYAHLLCVLQRQDEAILQAQLALELDPLNPMIQILYTNSLWFIYRCNADRTLIEKLLANDPNNYGANYVINYLSSNCGDYEEAIRTEKICLQTIMGGYFDQDRWEEIEMIFREKGYEEAYQKIVPIYEGLYSPETYPMELAIFYARANRYDMVMKMVEKGYEARDLTMPYLTTAYNFVPLYDNPQFIDILKKLDLPLPKSDS